MYTIASEEEEEEEQARGRAFLPLPPLTTQPDRGESSSPGRCWMDRIADCCMCFDRKYFGGSILRFSVFLALFLSSATLPVQADDADGASLSVCPVPSLLERLGILSDECYGFGDMKAAETIVSRVSEINGTTLDTALRLVQTSNGTIMAVLFHAEWCPFSKSLRTTFDMLSSLFPSIYHVAVEESTIQASVLSQYGIHSFPSIFVHNRTSRVRYHGSRTLQDLVVFYESVTGFQAVSGDGLTEEDIHNFLNTVLGDVVNKRQICPYPWAKSPEKWLREDTYLLLAAIFTICRLLYFVLQKVMKCMKRRWNSRTIYEVVGRRLSLAVSVRRDLIGNPTRQTAEFEQIGAAVENTNLKLGSFQEGVSTVAGGLPSWLPATRQMATASSSLTTAIAECSSSMAGVSDDTREASGMRQRMDGKYPNRNVWRP
eukprot:c21851_g1_i1 orf=147-1433(-)